MESDEDTVICFGLIRIRSGRAHQSSSSSLEDRPIDDVIDRLIELARAKWYHIDGLRHDKEEAQKSAVYYSKIDMQEARMHTALSLNYEATKNRELLKYQNMKLLISKLQEARQNAGLATAYFASAKTLKEVVDATPDLAQVMDDLRDQFDRVDEMSEEAAVPMRGGDDDVDDDVKRMVDEQNEREAAELDLPSVPLLRAGVGGGKSRTKVTL